MKDRDTEYLEEMYDRGFKLYDLVTVLNSKSGRKYSMSHDGDRAKVYREGKQIFERVE